MEDHRDMAKRGYSRDEVLRQIAEREARHRAYIRPQRTFADIVVTFYPPEAMPRRPAPSLNVRHLLRPTLPHPDLSPILDRARIPGLHLELSRDTDGKPVDLLEIHGDIAKRAERLEELLWSLVPEASHLRGNVGAFDAGGRQMSHPLALTQLLVGYHAVKAAMGIRAY